MNYEIIEFNPKTVSGSFAQEYCELREAIAKEVHPDDPVFDREVRIRQLREGRPDQERYCIAVMTPSKKVIGFGIAEWEEVTSPSYEKNKKFAEVNIEVHPDYRRQGIFSAIIKKLIVRIERLETIVSLRTFVALDIGRTISQKFGGKFSQGGAGTRLAIKSIDWGLMKKWKEDGKVVAKQENINLRFFEKCPDELIEKFSETYTEAMNLQPLGDWDGEIKVTPETRRKEEEQQLDKLGINWPTFATVEDNGDVSGITEMFYFPKMNYEIQQRLTGVLKKYRGRSIGKWLKAEMVFYIKEKYPTVQTIKTVNDPTNAAMMSINDRMGFKRTVVYTSYIHDLKTLKTKL